MKIQVATHLGMCFGVREALRTIHTAATRAPLTVLGQLVHNPEVDRHLSSLGVAKGDLSRPETAATHDVAITAHGASDADRARLRASGLRITDTTCPLVAKAHEALRILVREGYSPVVIGQRDHVEVRGLIGDFPHATVVLADTDVASVPPHPRIGVVSQTTQPLEIALALVERIKLARRESEVRFVDTVCHPTKQRQQAVADLCADCEVIIVIGGSNSNNTRQLREKAGLLGRRTYHVESADDLRPEWFRGVASVGVTAGTSTLDETIDNVLTRLRRMDA